MMRNTRNAVQGLVTWNGIWDIKYYGSKHFAQLVSFLHADVKDQGFNSYWHIHSSKSKHAETH